MKRIVSLLISVCLLTSCAKPADNTLSVQDVIERHQIDKTVLKENLNALDESQDSLDRYLFKTYHEVESLELTSKEFNAPLDMEVDFDFATKDGSVILCFPPKVTFLLKEDVKVEILDDWSYKLTKNKLYLTARIKVEKKTATGYIRNIETVIQTIDVIQQ